MADIDPPEDGHVFLDSVLNPHRSLPPRAFIIIMAGLAALSVLVGIVCVIVGAWPIFGFFGLDVLLVYVALKASYRSAKQHERVRLTDQALTVDRVSVRGERRHWQFEPFWLRVSLDPSDERGALTVASHGRRVELGRFLAPAERVSFAGTLKDALGRWRARIAASSSSK
ncbi:MAG TPA: DUF2244 domain-containing protein [Stellaceae bacterium]|nr:DUF2244 domain-containing protein [Stellaceae bacterium]